MRVLIPGLLLLAAAFLLQIAVWRVHVPRRQTIALLIIFLGVGVGSLPFLPLLPVVAPAAAPLVPENPADFLQLFLLIVSVTSAWMITFSAIDVDSPSLHLVMAIKRAGEGGLSEKDLRKMAADDRLVLPRIRDLVVDRMIAPQGTGYRLTSKGLVIARLFAFYRTIMNAGLGG